MNISSLVEIAKKRVYKRSPNNTPRARMPMTKATLLVDAYFGTIREEAAHKEGKAIIIKVSMAVFQDVILEVMVAMDSSSVSRRISRGKRNRKGKEPPEIIRFVTR